MKKYLSRIKATVMHTAYRSFLVGFWDTLLARFNPNYQGNYYRNKHIFKLRLIKFLQGFAYVFDGLFLIFTFGLIDLDFSTDFSAKYLLACMDIYKKEKKSR